MDNIYIDTSIFEANNFLEGKRINEILKLSEEKNISILLPSVTYFETKNRAIKNIKEAIQKFKSYRDNTRILRNVESISNKFEHIDEDLCIKEFLTIFENRLIKANCLIIEYPTLNIKEVFDKYFKNEFPFSKGDKKHEFPDAFALLSVELWCIENHEKCYVFSNDKDLQNYKSKYLIIVPSYEKYLDEKIRKVETYHRRKKRLDATAKLYNKEKIRLEEEINEWIKSMLDDVSTYYHYTDKEVHSINIKETTSELSDYQIMSINESEIIMEAKAEIYFQVEIEVDDENSGYYDNEDEDWIFRTTEIEIIEKHKNIMIQLITIFPIAGDEYVDIEIDQINNGSDLRF